jgi:hypothetical protein
MKSKGRTGARLTKELLEIAKDMQSSGIMPDAVYERIIRRHCEAETMPQSPIRDDN